MTISDIARMAGVSSTAVSRYFNNGYLSEDKKEAIRVVVEKTGYHPCAQAQMLRTKKTKIVGVVIPKIDSSSMGRVVSGILSVLNENGYRMLLADTQNDPKKELEYLTVFDETQVDGIILAGTVFSATYRKAMNRQKVPIVVVGQEITGFNCVYHDDYHAEYEMTSRVIESGRKNPGYIGVTEKDRAVGELRYKGYCDALKEHGMPECRAQHVISDFTYGTAYEKMGELMELWPDLDAVVCATDRIAIGARGWMIDHKPELLNKVLLCGQGDSDMTAVTNPPISTIHYYYEESGQAAARRLVEMMQNEDDRAVREVKLGYQLVNRIPGKTAEADHVENEK